MNDALIMLWTLLISLVLTLLLEWIAALIFKLKGRDIGLFLLVNLLTNPAAVFLNIMLCAIFPYISALAWQIPIELAVIAAEGIIYVKLSRSLHQPWLFAVCANVFSYTFGMIINLII